MFSKVLCILLLFSGMSLTFGQSIVPARKGNLWGFIDTSGKIIHDFVYTNPGSWKRNCYTAKKNNDLYFIYANGSTRYFENCDAAEIIDYNHFFIKRSGRYYFSDSIGRPYHNIGFEQVKSLKFNMDRYLFLQNGKWGVCNLEGQTIHPARYYSITELCLGYYRALVNNTHVTLLREADSKLLLDSIRSVSVIDANHFVFLCQGISKLYFLIDGDGNEIAKGRQITATLLKGEFMIVEVGNKTFLYDLKLRTKVSHAVAPFTSCDLPNTVLTGKGYYSRYSGELNIPTSVKLYSLNEYFLYNKDGYWGLWDSSYRSIIQANYSSIRHVGKSWFLLIDSSLSGALYHVKNRSFHSSFKYNFIYYDTQIIKAYDNSGGMDLYNLQNDSIISVTPIKNVVRIAVGKSDQENWLDDSRNIPIPFNSQGTRRNYWVTRVLRIGKESVNLFGLGYRDTVTNKFIRLSPAIFISVNVLQRPNLSIACYQYNPIEAPSVSGYSRFSFPSSYALVDDNTGKFIIKDAGYIDGDELENNASIVRAFTGSLMSLHEVNTGKILIRSTYISTETNGFRGVYVGGKYVANCKGNGAQVISEKMNGPIGFISIRTKRIENYGVQGGEWRASRNGILLNRIPENGKNRIQYLEPMHNGTAIYILSNGKYGVMDSMGKCIVKPNYDYIMRDLNTPDFFYCGMKSPSWGLVSNDGRILTPPIYTQIVPNGDHISARTMEQLLLDIYASDTVKLPLKSKLIGFENDAGFIKSKAGYMLYSTYGGIQYDNKFQKVTPFHSGYAAVCNRKGWGVIDASGDEIIPCKYKNAKTFGYTAAVLENNRRLKFVFPDESELRAPWWADAVEEIQPGYFVYKRGDKYAIYRANGRKWVGFRFSQVPALIGENIVGITSSTIYCIDKNSGKIRTFNNDKRYKMQSFTDEQLPIVYTKKSSSRRAMQISPAHYFVFTEDSLPENIFVPIEYSDRNMTLQKTQLFEAWSNDVYMLRSGGVYWYINGMGTELNAEKFRNAEPMKNGVAIVRNSLGYCGLLGNDMAYRIQPWFHHLKRVNDSVYAYNPRCKWEVCQPSVSSTPLVDGADFCEALPNGMVKMLKGNAIGYLRRDGQMVWDFTE